MMSLPRIFGLMLLFLFFEAVVAVVTTLFFPDRNVLLACAAMTGLAVGTWMIFVLLTRFASRQRTPKADGTQKAFVPAVSKASPGNDSFTLEFIALVQEANRRLQALVSGDGQGQPPTVASLPLYLVIGAEGSGKTSAIVNSGLEPRLLAGEAQKEGQVLPTALANLWFVEGNIFVEIAGRVLMQERDRWEKALQILQRKPRLPWWKKLLNGKPTGCNLRGVVVVCETDIFLKSRDVHRLGSVARTLNERLQSVQTAMREDFPIYVLFTRCDSVQYFQEFFAQLSDMESRRILGVTLPHSKSSNEYADVYSDREGSRLTKFLNRLYQSVADKRIVLLAREEVIEKRALAYEFPRELKKSRGEVVQFLLDVFRPSTLHPPYRLRGFYFSGKRVIPRAGLAADSISVDHSIVKRPAEATVFFRSSKGASALDHSVFAGSSDTTSISKWAFLTEVFKEIILGDPVGKTAPSPPHVADSKYVKIALGTVGVVFLLLSVIWVFSWQRNHGLLTEVQTAVSVTQTATAPGQNGALAQLEPLRPLMIRLHAYNRGAIPLSYRWGLYTGDRAATDLDRLYYTRFRQAVLDPTLKVLSANFLELQAGAQVNDDVYKELKAYRMITSGSCKPDDTLVASMMLPAWSNTVSQDPDAMAIGDKQIQFYAAELKLGDPYGKRIPENSEAVQKAQIYLQNLTGADKILEALLNQVRQEPAEHLSSYASNFSQVLSGPDAVDGPYTSAGWNAIENSIRDHKLVSNGETCVVGGSTGASGWTGDAAMDSRVQQLYSEAYRQSWKQFLEGHHVIPFTNSIDAAQKLHTLADNNRSPLLALVYMTSTNTDVAIPQSLSDRASDSVRNAATATSNTVKGLVNKLSGNPKNSPSQPASAAQPDTPLTVRAAFESVHAMVDPVSRDKWLNDKNQPYVKALSDLSDALQALPTEIHSDVPLETQELIQAKAAISAADTALHALEANFPNTPTGINIDIDLENLLREPIDLARKTVAAIAIVKPPPPPGPPGPPPPDPSALVKIKNTIRLVNGSAQGVCTTAASLQSKFPFDATSSTDATLNEFNQLLQPGTGAYSEFSTSTDVSKTYNHAGRVWAGKPEFPATFSQPFLSTLNSYDEVEDELYGQGSSNPHADLTLTVDGTGRIAFELEVDGHKMKYQPGKTSQPLRIVWPPITNSPTRLVLKNGTKGSNMAAPFAGPWGLFHLLQAADEQSGNLFTFRTFQLARSPIPLLSEKGTAGTIQIRVEGPASNIFTRGYFSKLRCNDTWALRDQTNGN